VDTSGTPSVNTAGRGARATPSVGLARWGRSPAGSRYVAAMTSGSPSGGRGQERRLSIRTLLIAAVGSATAAIVTSQFWAGGTPIAAALTPVIVALVGELLHRPTEMIAGRITSNSRAIHPDRTAAEPTREPGHLREPRPAPPGPVRIYRPRQAQRRKIAVGVVATTAVLAFAIAAAALTLPELIAGQSLVNGSRKTTLGGGHRAKPKDEKQAQPAVTETIPSRTTPTETVTVPAPKAPSKKKTPTKTNTTPTNTTTAPRR
jgi:hypothetical protein